MKTIFLDFDGVLFDSVKEAYLLARYAFRNIDPFEKIDESEYAIFYQNRYLITNSWHYYYIMKIITSKNAQTLDEFKKEYLYLLENREMEEEQEFDKKFQLMRKKLIENHYDFWKNLDKPYPFLEKLRNLNLKLDIYILSTKNKIAIINKFKEYNFFVEEGNIIGKDFLKNFNSKGEFLKIFLKENNIDYAIFIDDSSENIQSCLDIKNLDCFLASWGYTNELGYSDDEIISKIKELV